MQVDTNLAAFAARLEAFIGQCAPCLAARDSASAKDEFNRLALELFDLQFQLNPPYRRFCASHLQTPDTVEHWTQIPAVPTAAFKDNELTCLSPEQRSAVFHSSGTTQQRPSRHFHCPESLALYETSLWPSFTAAALPDLVRPERKINFGFLALTPPPDSAPHSSLVHMFGIIHRRLGSPGPGFTGRLAPDGAWELDTDRVCDALKTSEQARAPLLILGTAFLLVHLLDYLAERELRFQLPIGSRVTETGGYKGRSRTLSRAALHRQITERLHIDSSLIICEYGMSELSSQAYSIPDKLAATGSTGRVPFAFPPWARAQVISPETGREVAEGETGLLRICDLANTWSVMAVQTEDLGVRHGESFQLLGRAVLAEPRGCSLMAAP